MSLKPLLVPGVLACALVAGLSSAQMPDFEASDQDVAGINAAEGYHQRLATQLAAKGGARELALAALLRGKFTEGQMQPGAPAGDEPSQPVEEDANADAWRNRAAAAPGRDPIADLLLLVAGGQARREAVADWAKAEPDNAAPLLYGDQPVDALLAALRERQRFDLHYLDMARWLTQAYTDTPPNDQEAAAMFDSPAERDTFAANAAMGLWGSAIPLPNFTELLSACRGAALTKTPTRAADCRHLAEIMSGASDTAIGRAIGSGLRVDTAADEAARAAAEDARRSVAWQLRRFGETTSAQPDNGAAQLKRLLADASIHTEIDLIVRVLKEANIPLQPPADWRPEQP